MPQNVTSATSAAWIQVKSIVISSLDFMQLVSICKLMTEINLQLIVRIFIPKF